MKQRGVYYSAAYEDGDPRVVLYRSSDGRTWKAGPQIYGLSADTPLGTELILTPSGNRMLALVRMDGNDFELLGQRGRLRTKVCWARRPYGSFSCREELKGVRPSPGSPALASWRPGIRARRPRIRAGSRALAAGR